MIKAAIYVRVSTDQQAQEGDSIAAQLDALTKYVNDRPDMVLAGEYIDEGISGRKADRDELKRLLEDVEKGKIDTILFTKLDRWFRSVRHYTATQEILDKKNVTWTAIWEPIYDTTTPAGRLIVNQMMSIAQFEAENTGSRIRQVMAYKVSQGEAVTGKVPFGYRIENKHLVLVPEQAQLVRDLFEYYSKSGCLNSALRYGISIGINRKKQNLKMMLRNRKYIGEHRGNLSYCPPIITRELFDDVQAKLAMNVSMSAKRTYLFTGLLKCSVCGRRMASGYQASKDYVYYRCHGYYVPPRECTNRHIIGERNIEDYLIKEAQTLARQITVEASESQKKVRNTEKQISTLEKKMQRLKELFLNEMITLDEYKKDKESFEKEIEALRAPVKAPERDLSAIKELLSISDLKALISSLTKEERRYLWRGLIKEIIFFPDRHFEVHFK